MTILRWVLGVFSLLLASGCALSFVVYIAQGENDWLKLAHNFRRWTSAALLFWFNVEIWGRVVVGLFSL